MIFNGQNKFDIAFSKNNMLMRLIYINTAVFAGLMILHLPFWLMGSEINPNSWAANWFAIPSNLSQLLVRPWTLISYMFLHSGFPHLFFNMLLLYFLGQLFVQFLGEKKLFTVYIAGGIAGAILFVISFNLFPVFDRISSSSLALGASASVMAIVIAIATHVPNFSIRLFLLGNIKLKYIALLILFIDLVNISKSNSGGHIAHIGGALLGYTFAKQWAKGKDITLWVEKASMFFVALFKRKPKSKLHVEHKKSRDDFEYRAKVKEEQEQIDRILDKISKSGYDSLSKSERDILFKASKK